MKTMKVALLATAALAAVSVSARADDTAAIKAQLEALTARIAQLEAGPAVPTGFSLLTISEGTATVVPGSEVLNKDAANEGDKATVIGIMPTADLPATTTIEWSGYVRAAIVYTSLDGPDDYDVKTRGQITVVGKTDTAVGEVGAKVTLRANADGLGDVSYVSPTAWGWWAMTPEWTVGGGYQGSLGNIGYGYDGACSCYYTDNANVAMNPGDVTQMRLSFASGPLSMAVAIEDATSTFTADSATSIFTAPGFGGDGSSLGAAAEVKYSGDAFNAEISAVWHDGGDNLTTTIGATTADSDDSWQVGAGAGFSLGDMASISLAAATGHLRNNQDYWAASILVSADLSDAVKLEASYGMKEYDTGASTNWVNNPDVHAALAGIYYEPVDQLTVGLEAEWISPDGSSDTTSVDLVTVYRF